MAAFGGAVLNCTPTFIAAEPRPQLRSVTGPVILARSGAIDAFLWDATSFVTQLVQDNVFGDAAIRSLEASAISALAANGSDVTAATVSLRVVYSRSGAVSKAYGGATFAGVESVVTITVLRSDLTKHATEWERQLLDGVLPAAVKISVTGSLPSS